MIAPRSYSSGLKLSLAFALAASVAAAATPPDWLAASLADKASPRGREAIESVSSRGGAAVDLLRSTEVTFLSPDRIQTRRRLAVRVAAEAARRTAPTAETYNADNEKILSVNAWVVSADGKRVRHYGRGDLVDSVAQYSKYFWNSERVIRLDPSDKVEIGGVVAWEIQTESPYGVFGASCSFQSPHYILRGEFEVTPSPGAALIWHATSPRLGSPENGPAAGALRWQVSRLAPFPVDRPSGFIPNSLSVSVRCVPPAPSPAFARDWAGESRLVAGIVDPQSEEGGAIKAEADRLVAGKSAPWDRVRALTEFVQRDIVYLSITVDKDVLAGYRPHLASEVLRNRYGDCKDKANLLLSLLRAEGVPAKMVILYAGNPSVVLPDWPELSFNHAIVAVPAGGGAPPGWPAVDGGALGQVVLFDPTNPVAPLGTLSPSDEGGYGLIVDPEKGALIRFPSSQPATSGLVCTIQARLTPDGGVQADVEEVRRGRAALQLYTVRYLRGATEFARVLERRIHDAAPLEGGLRWTDAWDPAASRYRLNLHFHAGRFVRVVDESDVMITPQLLPAGVRLSPWTSRREGVVWLPGDAVTQEVKLPMPDGYRVEEMPDPWQDQAAAASGRLTYAVDGRTVVYRMELSRPGGFYTKPEYEALRKFYLNLHEAERRPILFRRQNAA